MVGVVDCSAAGELEDAYSAFLKQLEVIRTVRIGGEGSGWRLTRVLLFDAGLPHRAGAHLPGV